MIEVNGLTFEWECADSGEFVNVSNRRGGHLTSLDPAQAWELANYLTSGALNYHVEASELRNDYPCETEVWNAHLDAFVPCGCGIFCPACEYRLAVTDGFEG